MKQTIFIQLVFILISFSSFATHNKSGEITYIQIDEHTIKGIITTYTSLEARNADRDSLEICWGDRTCETIARVNGLDMNANGVADGELIFDGIKKNVYTSLHTYSDLGDYTLSMLDLNRNHGILNINFGRSEDVPFYLETTFTLTEKVNNSPTILIDPIDQGSVGESFIHILNAYDIDGDSLSYKISTPMDNADSNVPVYSSLDEIANNEGTSFSFDEHTGVLIWDSPIIPGQYTIAIEILTFRNGIQNGKILRDMEIIINPMLQLKPQIEASGMLSDVINEVWLGDTVEIELTVSNTEAVSLGSYSELFEDSDNIIDFDIIEESDEIKATFFWVVEEKNIREQPYQVVMKAINTSGTANFLLFQFNTRSTISSIESPILKKEKTKIYPNPCINAFFIESKNEEILNETYSICNLRGDVIKQGFLKYNESIEISDLGSGIYIINVENKHPFKLVKM